MKKMLFLSYNIFSKLKKLFYSKIELRSNIIRTKAARLFSPQVDANQSHTFHIFVSQDL